MTIRILLVEDDPGDVALIEESFASIGARVTLQVVSAGDDALALLRGEAPYVDAPRPDMMMLDLNLPRMGGLEVLEEIRADPSLRSMPVLVFTSSAASRDISLSYFHGANCFITKPDDFARYRDVVGVIERFWFETARMPTPALR